MKLIVYETSAIRNLQYDTEKLSNRVELLDPQKDILDFISQHKSNSKYFQPLKFEEYQSFLHTKIKKEIGRSELINNNSTQIISE